MQKSTKNPTARYGNVMVKTVKVKQTPKSPAGGTSKKAMDMAYTDAAKKGNLGKGFGGPAPKMKAPNKDLAGRY